MLIVLGFFILFRVVQTSHRVGLVFRFRACNFEVSDLREIVSLFHVGVIAIERGSTPVAPPYKLLATLLRAGQRRVEHQV